MSVDLRQYLRVLRRGWLLLTVITVLALGAATALTLLMPPTYQTESRIYVSVNNATDVNDLGQGTIYSQEIVRSFGELVTSSSVLQPVIEELGLPETPVELAEQVDVEVQTGTVILEITVSDEDPERTAAIAGALNESLNETVQSLTPDTGDNGTLISLTTVEEPTVPLRPASPQPPIILGLGLVAGLSLGLAALALRETLDTRVRTEEDITEITDVTVLGGVSFDRQIQQGILVSQADPGSPLAESFRTLRNNIQFLDVGSASRSFVITSSVQGEGKSSVTANLAISLRAAGHRVLLVDADLRRPEVAELLGLEGAVGLTDLLTDQAKLDDVIQPWGPDELSVLPAGTVPPNPNELLGSAKMRELVEALHQDYDIILFDAPPLMPVSDATVLGTMASGALLVVGVGRAHKPQLKKAVEALRMMDVRLFGLVPTLLPSRGADSYHRYRYTSDPDTR